MSVDRPIIESALIQVGLEPEPWRVSLRCAGVELRQAAPLSFLTEPRWPAGGIPPPDDPAELPDSSWYQVTGILEEERLAAGEYRAVLGTDHPDGLTATVAMSVRAPGELSFSAAIDGAAVCRQVFQAAPGERWLGFGERSHAAGLERGVIESYVGEGPYQAHEYPFLGETVPPWAIRNRLDATYFPVPWVLSTRGYGLLIDRDEVSYQRFRTGDDSRWSIEVEATHLDYSVFAGPTPLDALGRFSGSVGRQPAPERWWFGPWYQSGHANHVPQEEETRQLDVLQGAGAAVSAVETHCRYLPLGEDRDHEQEERSRTELFHSRGLAALSYINPLVGRDYEEAFHDAQQRGALLRHPSGAPYLFQAYAGGREPPHTLEAQYDFTASGAAAAWGAVAARIAAAGYDGWMEDFGEYTPLDARAEDGGTGTAAHNRYPTQYHRVAAEVAAEVERRGGRHLARFARSGWTGAAAFTPIVWGGDPTTSWGFDGLASAITEGLSMGASGVAMWGSDTGGFRSTFDRLTPELLIRWIQLSAFCPVMRTKAGGIEIPKYHRPQIWDDEVRPSWRRWSRWHTRLNDYLMAAHSTYRQTGRPIMCSLELAYPGFGPAEDQYMLGPDLLVAPVLEPGTERRRVGLPPGTWHHLFDPGRHYRGPGAVVIAVGLDDIPVMVRTGAVISLLPDDVVSVSPYAPPLDDRRQILAWPDTAGGASEGSLGPDHRFATHWDGPEWTLDLTASRPTEWEVEVRHPSGTYTRSLIGDHATLRLRYPEADHDEWGGPAERMAGRG